MYLSRREFLILAVGVTGVAATGCQSTARQLPPARDELINARAGE